MPSQDLVPDGLPYGERQKRVDSMRQAGLPLETPLPGAGGAAVSPVPRDSAASPTAPPNIDALSLLTPSPNSAPAPVSTRDRVLQAAGDAQGIMALVLRRVASRL